MTEYKIHFSAVLSRLWRPDFHEHREQQFSPSPDLPWPGLQSDWKIMAAELFPTKKLVPSASASSTTSIQQYQHQNLTNNNTTTAQGCCNWQGLFPTIRERSVWTPRAPDSDELFNPRGGWQRLMKRGHPLRQLDRLSFNKDSTGVQTLVQIRLLRCHLCRWIYVWKTAHILCYDSNRATVQASALTLSIQSITKSTYSHFLCLRFPNNTLVKMIRDMWTHRS